MPAFDLVAYPKVCEMGCAAEGGCGPRFLMTPASERCGPLLDSYLWLATPCHTVIAHRRGCASPATDTAAAKAGSSQHLYRRPEGLLHPVNLTVLFLYRA
jgi:hypothetical protein